MAEDAATLQPPEAQQVMFIAEVTIASTEDVQKLQQLGYSCSEGQVCRIEVTEAQLTPIEQAGLAVTVVGVTAEASLQPLEAEDPFRYGANDGDYVVSDWVDAISTISISGAPAGAMATKLRYEVRVAKHPQSFGGGPGDYVLTIRPASQSTGYTIWNQLGGWTDQGHDDDPEDDEDIHLINRWVDSILGWQAVNQTWYLKAEDRVYTNNSQGYIDSWKLWVYYCSSGPSGTTLVAPAHDSHTCDSTPTFDWTDVSGVTSYNIQVDDSPTFSSPAINTIRTVSNYTASSPLSRKTWYWRVRPRNQCDVGPWSAVRSLTIDQPPAVPVPQAPANGSHTTDSRPSFDWANAAGATSYAIQVDDMPSFASPEVNNISTTSDFRPSTPLAPQRYYWRVQSRSACGESAWSSVWSFTVGGANQLPENLSLWPDHGGRAVGRRVNFTSTYRDRDGWHDLAQLFLHIGRTTASSGNVMLRYDVRKNRLYMNNNAGTGWIGGCAPGSAQGIRNQQGTLSCAKSTVTKSGRILKVKWNLLFKAAFRGRKNSYMRVADRQGARTLWEQMGTWRVQ